MRKKDKEITDPTVISEIIKKCMVCRLGLSKDNLPYIVPVSFGYDGGAIYIHTAAAGKKIDYIQANNRVCVEFENDLRIVPHDDLACKWTVSFQSVIGYGQIDELTELNEKTKGLEYIMAHYSDKKWEFNEKALDMTRIWKITIERVTGKQSNTGVNRNGI